MAFPVLPGQDGNADDVGARRPVISAVGQQRGS